MKIDMWYDRYTKNWVVQLKDSKGYQIGDAHYVYTKREASDIAKEIRSKLKKGAWATEFMDRYNQMGESNFIDPRDRIIDGVQVNLTDFEEKDKVVKIWTILSRYQGKGKGSKVLEQLKDLADETKTSIVLKPGKWGLFSNLSIPELKEWYMRHGFKPIKNGWLIYKPRGVVVKADLGKRLGTGFWGKPSRRKSSIRSQKPKVGRVR
jgi:GNAT superfamily N-acetyltransferase